MRLLVTTSIGNQLVFRVPVSKALLSSWQDLINIRPVFILCVPFKKENVPFQFIAAICIKFLQMNRRISGSTKSAQDTRRRQILIRHIGFANVVCILTFSVQGKRDPGSRPGENDSFVSEILSLNCNRFCRKKVSISLREQLA